MKPLLLLTKSILHEQPLQQEIQQFGQEVFCTSEVLTLLDEQGKRQQAALFACFSRILISETIGDSELKELLILLQDQSVTIIRMADQLPTSEERRNWERQGVSDWLPVTHSMESLREIALPAKEEHTVSLDQLYWLHKQEEAGREWPVRLSKKERKLLSILLKTPDQCCSRQQICQQIWGVESDSTKSQLSCLITKIKNKLNSLPASEELIQTVWGKGYVISKSHAKLIKEWME